MSRTGTGALRCGAEPAPFALELDERIGQTIAGRYLLRERIGRGGMAVVYRATRVGGGDDVAVKLLHDDIASDPRFLRRFEVEVRALARLRHPHCGSIEDFGSDLGAGGVPYIVMPYLRGRSLRDELDRGPLPAGRALDIARQLLAGLGHAHRSGVIHRDVKPANVMLETRDARRDHVRLLDFGLAKLREPLAWIPPTNPLFAVGTPSYMAPEQFAGGHVDARVDIYSTGAVLFEMLTGCKPFVFDSPADGYAMHRDLPRPRLCSTVAGARLSVELEWVVLRAMAQQPADRFATTDELSDALDRTPEASATRGAPIAVGTGSQRAAEPVPEPADWHGGDTTAPHLPALPLPPPPPPARARYALLQADGHRPSRSRIVDALAVLIAGVIAFGVAGTEPPSDARDETAAVVAAAAPAAVTASDPAADALVREADAAFDASRWSRAIALYRRAVRLDASLRYRPHIHANAIEALRGRRSAGPAARFIERDLGVVALPFLERAARDHDSPRVRQRARRVARALARQRP